MTENGGYFYSAAPARQVARRDAASALARFAGRIGWRDEELVLDVGCGGGDITSTLLLPAVAAGVAKRAASLGGRSLAAKEGGGRARCARLFSNKVGACALNSCPLTPLSDYAAYFKNRSEAATAIPMSGTAEGKFTLVGIDACEMLVGCANEAYAQNDVLSFAKVDVSRELSPRR